MGDTIEKSLWVNTVLGLNGSTKNRSTSDDVIQSMSLPSHNCILTYWNKWRQILLFSQFIMLKKAFVIRNHGSVVVGAFDGFIRGSEFASPSGGIFFFYFYVLFFWFPIFSFTYTNKNMKSLFSFLISVNLAFFKDITSIKTK